MGKSKKGGSINNNDETDTNVGFNTNSMPYENEMNSVSDTDNMSKGWTHYMSPQNLAIIILAVLLILSFLGVNILIIFGGIIQFLTALIGPLISNVLSIFGYTTGTIINGTANIVSDTAKTGIDIMDGTAHSVGNLFRGASNVNGNLPVQQQLDGEMLAASPLIIEQPIPVEVPNFDQALNTPSVYVPNNPVSDEVSSLIQSAISSNKSSWCLVGENAGRRGCITVQDPTQCMSGQVYDNQQDCLNLQPDNGLNGLNGQNTSQQPNQLQNQLAPPYANGTMNWGLPPPPPPQFYGVQMRMQPNPIMQPPPMQPPLMQPPIMQPPLMQPNMVRMQPPMQPNMNNMQPPPMQPNMNNMQPPMQPNMVRMPPVYN